MEKTSFSVKIKCILFFFIILFPSYIYAEETAQAPPETQKPVTVTSSLSPAEAFLGDVITYTITIFKTPETVVKRPGLQPDYSKLPAVPALHHQTAAVRLLAGIFWQP